jgi:hypothetical protein
MTAYEREKRCYYNDAYGFGTVCRWYGEASATGARARYIYHDSRTHLKEDTLVHNAVSKRALLEIELLTILMVFGGLVVD